MAVTQRERASRGGRKAYSWQVKWRHKGSGAWQTVTLDNKGDAYALDEAVKKGGCAYLKDDPAITTLSIIGKPVATTAASVRDQTLAQAVEEWVERPGLSKGSKKNYTQVLRLVQKSPLADVMVADLTPAELNAWWLSTISGYSPNYRLTARIVVNGALARAGRTGLLADIAERGGRLVLPIYLTRTQINTLLGAAVERLGPETGFAVELSTTAGTRWGETFGMEIERFDFGSKLANITRGINNGSRLVDGWSPVPLKTDKSRRVVPLPADYCDRLADHYGARRHGIAFAPRSPLRGATWWNHRTWDYQWRRLVESVDGIPDNLRYHDLRHSAAKNMLERGAPIGYVSRVLGHSSIAVTHAEYGGFDTHSHDILRAAME